MISMSLPVLTIGVDKSERAQYVLYVRETTTTFVAASCFTALNSIES